jgi:methylmalonyl-CoA/ethylmalonyl-CoA epimerase
MSDRGALRLHHVGYAAKNIDTIRDLYVNRYGYEICTPVIHDPLQTALVQFLRLAGDQSYLELVTPDRPESALALATQRGGGLNHLCFTCGRLEPAIEHLETMQMKLISEPKLAVAFGGRRICWLVGLDRVPIELVERRDETDLCIPGLATADDVPVHSGSST